MTKDRILQTKEIAAEIGCSDETIRRWFREDKLRGSYKVGGRTSPIRIRSRDLARLKKKRKEVQ